MAMSADAQTLSFLNDFGKSVINDAAIELGARQAKKSYRATWKNGVLRSYQTTTKRYSSDTTQKLKKSLKYEIKEVQDNIIVIFKAEEYWYYVNFGRKPGTYAPVNVIRDWVRKKPIKPQKGGGKGFAKVGKNTVNTLAFLINRKIKTFGIEGTRFFSKTVDIYKQDLSERLGKRIAKDISKQILEWPIQ